MEVKTSELTGAALDWAVAKCERVTVSFTPPEPSPRLIGVEYEPPYDPHSNWNLGGPIIERAGIGLDYYPDGGHPQGGEWGALTNEGTVESFGPTPLIAAMRCYVASVMGDEIEVPDELVAEFRG